MNKARPTHVVDTRQDPRAERGTAALIARYIQELADATKRPPVERERLA